MGRVIDSEKPGASADSPPGNTGRCTAELLSRRPVASNECRSHGLSFVMFMTGNNDDRPA